LAAQKEALQIIFNCLGKINVNYDNQSIKSTISILKEIQMEFPKILPNSNFPIKIEQIIVALEEEKRKP
jgi:hypothetical protein